MKERILWQTAALCLGFLIDFFVGDPYSIPHPVVAIGKWISFFDRKLRRGNSNPKARFRPRFCSRGHGGSIRRCISR